MSRDRAQEQRDIFAKNLKKYMERRDITQADIVTTLNVTASTVSDWVNARKYPRVDKMQLLAELLHVRISDLREPCEDDPDAERRRIIETAKIALFDGAGEVTDAMWEEVVNFAHFVEAREAAKKDDNT